MALSRYGGVTGTSKISEDFENINVAFNNVADENDGIIADVNQDKQALEAHKTSITAHTAENISYSGAVIGANNAKQAIDKLKQEVNNLVLDGGDSNPEVVAARGGYDTLGDRLDTVDAKFENINRGKIKNIPQIVAHRGFAAYFPENTIPAVTGSYGLGADTVEVDVRWTSDDVCIVMHDATVDRTTNGTGAVSELTYDYIKTLDAGAKFSPEWAGTKVPTLRDVLEAARGKGKLQIELKVTPTVSNLQSVINDINDLGMSRDVMFISFSLANLQMVRDLSDIEIGYLSDLETSITDVLTLGNGVLLMSIAAVLANPSIVSNAKSQGVDVGAWTITLPSQAIDLQKAGVYRWASDIPLFKGAV